jgi:putative tryptophan/tyrosine transport system substrate-binding protein
MRRREFMKLIGGVVLSWPCVTIGQQTGKVPTIGFLGTPAQSGWPVEAFDKRLRELGWVDGQTITIRYRWAEGRDERITEFVAEFVRSRVDIIVTVEMPCLLQSKRHRPFRSFSLWL